MSSKLRVVLSLRLGLVLLACVAGCQPGGRFDLSGGWSGTFTYTSGPYTSFVSSFRMSLMDDDGEISGWAWFQTSGLQEFQIPITLGEAHADTVILEATGTNDLVSPAADVQFSFDGNVSATAMSGIGTQTVNGTSFTFSWQATLTAPPAPGS